MFSAGCQYRTCQGIEDGTVRGVSPRKFILAFFDSLCNCEVAKDFKDATASRKIDSPVPFDHTGRALSCECDPESGQHVQDVAQRNAHDRHLDTSIGLPQEQTACRVLTGTATSHRTRQLIRSQVLFEVPREQVNRAG